MKDIDAVPSNVQSARQEALLCVFEDNEAAIKMIMKGRSPTMRHVSRTHRVALDWLFDRINLDPKIQIKYTDTKNQLADILTKGNFTRDEWNHLLNLFNISHFSSTACTAAMAKRAQQGSGEEHSQIATHDEFDSEDAFGRAVFNSTSSNPVKTWYGKMNCSARRPCFINHFFLTFDFRQVPRRNFLQFFPFLVHCCFRCWKFQSLRHRNKFVNQIVVLQ